MTTLNDLHSISSTFSNTDKMPVLFLGHGSPMNAIEENQFVAGFRDLAKTLPQPNAILCISAHWFTNGTKVTSMQMPRTIHDFGGFPQALFDVQYPAKGSPELAAETKKILEPVHVDLDEHWGLDHGAWSVIKHLYPEANVPVIQLSIDYTKSGQYHFELAQKLQSLRHKGVLIIGSGNIVHNLRQLYAENSEPADWASEFDNWVKNHLERRDFTPLHSSYLEAPHGPMSVPTPDHYFPLLYVLGASTSNDNLTFDYEGFQFGSLSMRCLRFS